METHQNLLTLEYATVRSPHDSGVLEGRKWCIDSLLSVHWLWSSIFALSASIYRGTTPPATRENPREPTCIAPQPIVKNVYFQALGSISPWLFGTCWPKMSILSWVFWWWMPTRPIKTLTFRLWVQFHHGFLALFDQKCQYYHGFFDGGCPLVP